MNQEDKNAVLQFMGQMYGESKKNDGMLINQSTNLKPKSDEIKDVFEKTLHSTVQERSQHNPAAPHMEPPVMAPSEAPAYASTPALVTPEQAAAALAETVAPERVPLPVSVVHEEVRVAPDQEQLEFDLTEPSKIDKLLDLIKAQNKIISTINKNIELIAESLNTTSKPPTTKNAKGNK
tara:strand:- start:5170 stop:5706 length:537 start_codon:yes stop_codon:yes gene_type:complete